MQVILIGAGNLATCISPSIVDAGNKIIQVIAKNEKSAKLLANSIDCEYSSDLKSIITTADLYIIASPDKNIPIIINSLPHLNGVVVHCSGSTSLGILKDVKATGYGVLYPFQTFTKTRSIDLKEVPFLIEANSEDTFDTIYNFAQTLSSNVININSEARSWIHLSGVFTNNFINHLLVISSKILSEKNIDTAILQPLLIETILKALAIGPANAQTGPAIRLDDSTMIKHIEMLKQLSPELAKIYKELSLSIQSTTKPKK